MDVPRGRSKWWQDERPGEPTGSLAGVELLADREVCPPRMCVRSSIVPGTLLRTSWLHLPPR